MNENSRSAQELRTSKKTPPPRRSHQNIASSASGRSGGRLSGLRQRLELPVSAAYLWVVMVLFGAIVLETIMIYPNIFAKPPQSLALTMEFLSVSGPSDFFPPLGFASWVLGALTLIVSWPRPQARWWILSSLAMLASEGVVSMAYFWPRNEIMFLQGTAVHSADYLIQVAREFETWHWRSRMGFNTVAAAAAFVGFLRLYRTHITAGLTEGGVGPAPTPTRDTRRG